MDLERMAKMDDCIYRCNQILNSLDNNQDDISRCVGTDTAETYRALMSSLRKEMKAARNDLLYLRNLG